jgi:hypothetical protein
VHLILLASFNADHLHLRIRVIAVNFILLYQIFRRTPDANYMGEAVIPLRELKQEVSEAVQSEVGVNCTLLLLFHGISRLAFVRCVFTIFSCMPSFPDN